MKLLKYLLLGLFLTVSGVTEAQFGTRFPTNVRYIGGGYINQRPFFNTLRAALNDVKATASVTNPYTFWIASDTTFIADWDSVYNHGRTMSDSITVNYVATGKIKWMGLNTVTTIHFTVSDSTGFITGATDYDNLRWEAATQSWRVQTLDTLKQLVVEYKTPEQFQAVANGIVDDRIPIINAINASYGKELRFTAPSYRVSAPIVIDMAGKDLDIKFVEGSKLVMEGSSTGTYYNNTAQLTFKNGRNLNISGLQVQASGTGSYQNGIQIDTVTRVFLDGVKVKHSKFIGLRAETIEELYVNNCTADSNGYAGLVLINTNHSTVVGGSYSYNGTTPFVDGYGISYSHQNGTFQDNRDITITGVQALYNLRKGIDGHGGIGAYIAGNHVKGYTYAGIYWVGNGDNLAGNLMDVKDAVITGNIVEQDSTWFANLNLTGQTAYSHGIQVGLYRPTYVTSGQPIKPGGVFKVTNNVLKNLVSRNNSTLWSQYGIHSFAGASAEIDIENNSIINGKFQVATIALVSGNEDDQPNIVKITGNSIDSSTAVTDMILVTAGKTVRVSDNQISASHVTTDSTAAISVFNYLAGADIRNIQVDHNMISGAFDYGIRVMCDSAVASITNNHFDGTYNLEKIFTDLAGTGINMSGNTAANVGITAPILTRGAISHRLPDKISAQSGTAEYSINTSSVYPNTINTLTLPCTWNGGNAQFEVTVYVTNGYGKQMSYVFNARAYNDGTSHWGTQLVSEATYDADSTTLATYLPIVSWSGATDTRILQVICPTQYTTYHVFIKFTTWDLTPY